jgi:hypothetical protein
VKRKPGETWRCEACSAPLIAAETSQGNTMPVDFNPDKGGDLMLFRQAGDHHLRAGVVTCRVAKGGHLAWLREQDFPLRTSHFATCPDAARFRKPA